MDKLKMETPDVTAENIEKIGALFPSAVTEMRGEDGSIKKGVNFEMLKQLLSPDVVEEGDERYEFTWVGKKQAIAEAARPTNKTLRPVKEDSRNWDTTENLYIEGDNLEVLKILQESYLGKIKMIYIDPPYNTGHDFIYRDDFAISQEEWSEKSGEWSEDGNRLFENTESNGRFHSDWCSMIHSRLKLARNLLTEDGVIFLSVDDNEADNLKKMCDEIFGQANFISCMVWRRSGTGGLRGIFPVTTHEYMLCYARQKSYITERWMAPYSEDSLNAFSHQDEKGPYKTQALYLTSLKQTPNQSYPIELPDGTFAHLPEGVGAWRFIRETYDEQLRQGMILFKKVASSPLLLQDGSRAAYNIYTKQYLSADGTNPPTIFPEDLVGQTRAARAELKKLLGRDVFDYAKPTDLIHYILKLTGCPKDSIILDFFSGSATTAHAVMQLNAEDGGHRKFIMVQLPEPCDEKSEAFKAGYKNICEIGKERIRRAGDKIKAEHPDADLDIGFRVFRVDESNMKNVYYHPEEVTQLMLGETVSNIKEDRTDMDLLYACLLDWGVEINLPHTSTQVAGCTVHNVDNGALAACFDKAVPRAVVEYIANLQPLRAVFRDEAFATDAEKINVTEIFKNLSPDTKVKVI